MIGFLARRLFLSITVVISVSIIAFVLLRLSGDIAQTLAGPTASVEDVERLRAAHGLDRPLAIQYLSWAAGVLSGDLGTSLFARQPVWDMVISRLPMTLR
jgi:peptide/nickel transport system permease protein